MDLYPIKVIILNTKINWRTNLFFSNPTPTNPWENVIDSIVSCKAVVSSSLHGLICSDAYSIPNLWLDEFKLQKGDFKFKDYFVPKIDSTKKSHL